MTDVHLVDTFQAVAKEVYLSLISECEEETKQELITSIFKLRRSIRWYLVSNDDALDSIWRTIREDEDVTDFILTGTSLFLLKTGYGDEAYKSTLSRSARSIGWVMHSSIIDSAITERSESSNWFEEVFTQAPWVFFLFVLTTVPQV
jgi:hypothetical protein